MIFRVQIHIPIRIPNPNARRARCKSSPQIMSLQTLSPLLHLPFPAFPTLQNPRLHGSSTSLSSSSHSNNSLHFNCARKPCSGIRQRRRCAREIAVKCSMSSDCGAEAAEGSQGATMEEEDAKYMRMCVALAKQAMGHTSPNPMVGCVIVKDGKVVGRGFHPKAGEPHAEVFAIREAGQLAEGATAYVSLEPCNHHGRTPPCSQALVRAKLKRVVVGVVDPNPQVAGKGVRTLRNAGMEVVVGVEEALCHATNEAFMHRMHTNQPFVTLRYSMSLDGGILGSIGVNNAQGGLYSKLLQENDAVVVTDAAVYDNPVLLCSEPGAKQPLRVILARSFDLPFDSHVFDTSTAKTVVLADQNLCEEDLQSKSRQEGKSTEYWLRAHGVDVVMMKDLSLDQVLKVCYQRGACSVLLDCRGPDFSGLENFLGQQALEEDAAHKVVVHVAPIFLGESSTAPGFRMDSDLIKLERVCTYMAGNDVVIQGYFPQSNSKKNDPSV